MPAKMFKCVICEKDVSKPKSYSVERLGLGDEGRACRSHEVVQEAIKALEESERQQKTIREVIGDFDIMMLVEKIRVEEYLVGRKFPLLCYKNLKHELNLEDKDIEEIKKRVEELGPLSTADVVVAMAVNPDVKAQVREVLSQ